MLLNATTLALLTQAVNAAYMTGLDKKSAPWEILANRIPSSTGENIYPYIKSIGSIRKWVGDRVIQNLAKGEFKLGNEDFEQTEGIPRNAIMDDQYGVYMPRFEQMGRNVANFPAQKLYALLKSGFESLRGRIPGLLHLEVGVDDSRIDYACDVVLLTEFASREALAAYADHPEHLRVRRTLGDLRTARHQVDYEIPAPLEQP